ncbi:MAG TPA: serine/threonine-protein kinase [Ktedonobacterales bacterium]|nr:serine/threonine-protein kinase [Ktedonobacterales bacterium]
MADRTGQQLGNYRLQHLLGKGGFAEVYLGEHVFLHTFAAIKVLLAHLSEQEMQGFLKEAQTVAHLTHPHIVKVRDFGIQAETPYLVMDYAPNRTVRDNYPGNQPLPREKVLSYLKQVADALHYVHTQKLIHRDIKPVNMLLGPGDEILLSDFGIAVIAQSTSRQSAQGFAGTATYMAPEQITGHAVPASDQYALAVVVYEWLTGMPPFEGSQVEVIGKHLHQPPPPLRARVPGISPAIEQVVLTALKKDPKERFASIQAFANAFEQACLPPQRISVPTPGLPPITPTPPPPQPARVSEPPAPAAAPTDVVPLERRPSGQQFQKTLPQLAEPPRNPFPAPAGPKPASPRYTLPPAPKAPARPAGGTSRQPLSRRKVLVAGGALAGLAAVGGGGVWLERIFSSPPAGTLVYTYRGHSNTVNAVAWSPDGKRIASGSDDGTMQVWNATNGSFAVTYGVSNTVNAVAWSPDGKYIASGSQDTTVQVWDASNGGNIYTYHGHSYFVGSVAWSPDSNRIASGSWDHTVQVWGASTGSNVYTYRGHSGPVYSVAWSPDGKRIASASADTTVQVWDASTGSHVYTYRNQFSVESVAWSPDGKRIASANADTTVQVWDASTGSHVYTYRGHSNAVRSVAWSPDGKYIASGSYDNTVQVWVAP